MIIKACVLYRNFKKRDMKQWTLFLLFGHFQRKEAEGEKKGKWNFDSKTIRFLLTLYFPTKDT